MLRCRNCGATFEPENAETHDEIHRIDGQAHVEKWAACPECRDTDLEEVLSCPICGGWTRLGACQVCKGTIHRTLQHTMSLSDTKDGKEAILDEIQEFVEEYET